MVQIMTSQKKPYRVIENTTNLQLMCFVIDANPNVTFYRWYKDGILMQNYSANYTILTVRRRDAGNYSCAASNIVGTSSSSSNINLDVLCELKLQKSNV